MTHIGVVHRSHIGVVHRIHHIGVVHRSHIVFFLSRSVMTILRIMSWISMMLWNVSSNIFDVAI